MTQKSFVSFWEKIMNNVHEKLFKEIKMIQEEVVYTALIENPDLKDLLFDITNEIVQISDNINPSTWIPDSGIINPYKP